MHSALVRVPGLLYEIGLSPHAAEVLAIRIEVDTRPPAGATMDTSLVRRHETLRLFHHDHASLLAGKLQARAGLSALPPWSALKRRQPGGRRQRKPGAPSRQRFRL